MKKDQWAKLKKGMTVTHKRYGDCSVEDATDLTFGVVIRPKTSEGKALLAADCGIPDIPLMESSYRNLT